MRYAHPPFRTVGFYLLTWKRVLPFFQKIDNLVGGGESALSIGLRPDLKRIFFTVARL